MRSNINIQVIKKYTASERLRAIFATRYVQFKDLRVKMSFIFRIKGVMEIGNAFKSFSEIPFKLELVDVWTSIKTWRNYGIIMTKSSVIKALPIEIGES